MIRFGHFYLNGKLMIYDVSLELIQGRRLFVASLSEDPRVSVKAVRLENAVQQLQSHLSSAPQPRFTPRVSWCDDATAKTNANVFAQAMY